MIKYIPINNIIDINLDILSSKSNYYFINIKYININDYLESFIDQINIILKNNNLNLILKDQINKGGFSYIYNLNDDQNIAKICFINKNFEYKKYIRFYELLYSSSIVPSLHYVININNKILIKIFDKYDYDLLILCENTFYNIIYNQFNIKENFDNLNNYIQKYLNLIYKMIELDYISSDFKLENCIVKINTFETKLIDIDDYLCIKYSHNKLSLYFFKICFKINIIPKFYIENTHTNCDYYFKIITDKFIFNLLEYLFDSDDHLYIDYLVDNKIHLEALIENLELKNFFYCYKTQILNHLTNENLKSININSNYNKIISEYLNYLYKYYNENLYLLLFNNPYPSKIKTNLNYLIKLSSL